MRTTLTLDPDVAAMLKKAVARGDATFKDVVNDALRRGLQRETSAPRERFVRRVWPNGGTDYLVPPEDWKQLLEAEDLEKFLDLGRR